MKILKIGLATALLLQGVLACGGGVPIRVRIDDFTMDLNLEEAIASMEQELAGVVPALSTGLPEVWPESLPDIIYPFHMKTPPVPIDLSPEEGAMADKYKEINKAKNALKRIEINNLILRFESNSLTVPVPELSMQIASELDAHPDDRSAWFSVGKMPGKDAGFTGDIDFEWALGGESALNAQLGDEAKEFSIRSVGSFLFDTRKERRLPRGAGKIRLIVVATFFVDPGGAI